MKQTLLTVGISMLLFVTMGLVVVYGYGEGPNDSGRWVYGHLAYKDGSKCGKCGAISIETENGFSKEGFTDNDGDYKIYVKSDYVKVVYFRGDKVWKGSEKTKGGVQIDITVR